MEIVYDTSTECDGGLIVSSVHGGGRLVMKFETESDSDVALWKGLFCTLARRVGTSFPPVYFNPSASRYRC